MNYIRDDTTNLTIVNVNKIVAINNLNNQEIVPISRFVRLKKYIILCNKLLIQINRKKAQFTLVK